MLAMIPATIGAINKAKIAPMTLRWLVRRGTVVAGDVVRFHGGVLRCDG